MISLSYRAEALERIYQGLIQLPPFERALVAHALKNSLAMLPLDGDVGRDADQLRRDLLRGCDDDPD